MMAPNLCSLQMDCPMSKPSASISVGVLWTWDQLKWSPMYWRSQIRRNTSSSWNNHLLELRLWIASSIGKFKWPQLLAFELLGVCGEISSKPPERCEFYPHLPNFSVSLCFLFETLLTILFYLCEACNSLHHLKWSCTFPTWGTSNIFGGRNCVHWSSSKQHPPHPAAVPPHFGTARPGFGELVDLDWVKRCAT